MNKKIENTKLKNSIVSTISLLLFATSLVACSSSSGGSSPAVAPTVLTITPLGGEPIGSGAELVPEERDGSGAPVLIGTIGDNNNTTASSGITYKLVTTTALEDYESDNVFFEIGTDGVTISYVGPAMDFDTALANARIFIISIERVSSTGHTETFRYITNLKDTVPIITGYLPLAEGATEITEYIAVGNVGADLFEMGFVVGAEGDTITIDFVEHTNTLRISITPQYRNPDNPDTDEVVGFQIAVGTDISFANMLSTFTAQVGGQQSFDLTSSEDFAIWKDYAKIVKSIGTMTGSTNSDDDIFIDVVTLTGTERGIVVDEGTLTSVTIANFDSTDTVAYSLSGADSEDFTIDESTGELKFATVPDYETPADADTNNLYEITITADDGTSTDTYDLLLIVADVTD